MRRSHTKGFRAVFGAVIALAVAGNALAYDYIIESRTGGKNLDKYSDVSCANSSVKSQAVGTTPGIGCRYATSTAAQATYTFSPNQSGVWSVYVTWPASTNGDSSVQHQVNYEGGTHSANLNQNQGGGLQHTWVHLGDFQFNQGSTYTVVQSNPTLEGAATPRLMADAVKFTSTFPNCGDTVAVGVATPVLIGDTQVIVTGVSAGATAVNVYAFDGVSSTLIGTNNAPTAGNVTVTVPALAANQHINATQVLGGLESCVATDGPMPGCGSVPTVSISGVLVAGDTSVQVSGVHPNATGVTVLSNGSQIGANNSLPGGGATPSTVSVTVTAIQENATIAAKQKISICESGVGPGKVVDCTQVPAVSVVGLVDAGRQKVRVSGVGAAATAVKVYADATLIGTNNAPTAGVTVVNTAALALGQTIRAVQTIRRDGCMPTTGRRVMAANVMEDFEDLVAADIPNQVPVTGGENRKWYNIHSSGLAVTTPTAGSLLGSKAIRYEDNGWTNGMYAKYEQVIPATGTYHMQIDMLVDEVAKGDPDWLNQFQVGLIINGQHRLPDAQLATVTEPKGSYPCLTSGVDGADATEAILVYVATFEANEGDDILIVFATDVGSYSRSKANTTPFSGMLIDNIRLIPGAKPPVCTDVPSPNVLPTASSPLEAGNTIVTVNNIDPNATEVRVFANGALIGSSGSGGSTQVDLLVPPLTAGVTLTASQTVGALESCQCPGAVGPVVGTGKNSEVLITLGIRETGAGTCGTTIGCDAGVTGNIEWVGAATTVGGAPQGKSLPASTDWQTVTFAAPAAGGTDPVLSFSAGNGVLDGTWGTLEHIAISTKGENTGRYVMYVDEIYNGTTKVCGFETSEDASMTPGALAMFRPPNNSGSTSANLLGFPMFAEVDGTQAADGTQSYRFEFQFLDNAPKRWVRLTTVDTTASTDMFRQNPMIDLTKPITMKILLFGQPPCGAVFADADGDGDVDMADFAVLQRCMTVEGFEVPTECSCFDRPFDGKIGADDLTSFHNCASGPGIPADPACDD